MNRVLVLLVFTLASCNNSSTGKNTKANDLVEEVHSELKQLVSPAGANSAEPSLFTDKNGLVYLSWIEKTTDGSQLKFSTLTNEKWSEPLVISSGNNWFVNWADYPVLAADGRGNLIAHFLEKSDTGKFTYDVRLITSADQGKTWSSLKLLHDDGKKAEHGFVSMIPYGDNYFISWLDGRNTGMETMDGHEGHHGQMTIRGAVVDKQGEKSQEWELDDRVCDCCQTSSAITANGPVVVYRDRSGEEIRDISIVRFINNKWTNPETVFPDNWKIKGCPVNGPRIVASGNTVAIAWFSSPGNNARVNVIFSEDGGASFKSPVRIDEGNGIGRIGMVMLEDNTVIVTWMEGSAIKATRVHTGGKKEPSMIIAVSSESRSSGFPQLTKSGNRLVFAYTDEKEKSIKTAYRLLPD